MTLNEAIAVPTNDLLRHVQVRIGVHASDTVWIRSVRSTATSAIVSVGVGVVVLIGDLPTVRERLAATLRVLDEAISHPETWDVLRQPDGSRLFVDHGSGSPHPKWVGPNISSGTVEDDHDDRSGS